MPLREFSVLFMVCAFWGLHFTVLRVTVGELGNPFFYAAIRMSIVALLLSPFLKWHTGQMKMIGMAGLGFGALNYAFMFPAMGMTTAGAASIAIELYVPFSILLAVIFLGERVGPVRIGGIIVAFAGVAIIAAGKPDEAVGPLFLAGLILIAGAAFCEAVGAIFVKSIKQVGPFQLLAWFAIIGSVVLWPLTLIFEQDHLAVFAPQTVVQFSLALAYSVVLASIVAHGSYYWLLGRLPMYQIAGTGFLNPLIGITAGVMLLGEPLNAAMFIGALMTTGGVFLILVRGKKPKSAPAMPES